MRIRLLAMLAATCLALGPVQAVASPPDDEQEQQPTPCEARAIQIAEHASTYTDRANSTDVPFTLADNTAKSCGVLLKGITQLREMGCPESVVQYAVDAHKQVKEILDGINSRYDFRFNCFVPDFG